MSRRRFYCDNLQAESITSQETNGVATSALLERNLGTVYATLNVGASATAPGAYSIYNLTANNVELTLPASSSTALGRSIYVTAPGTGCKILAPGGDLRNGSSIVGAGGLDISQGAAEVLCVANSAPGWVVISKYIPA